MQIFQPTITGSLLVTGSITLVGPLTATSFTGSILGTASTASYVLTAQTASFVTGSIFTGTNIARSSSFTSTASFVNTLNQNVLITGSLTVGSSSIGSGENTLIIGLPPNGGAGEGGQILLSAAGGTYTTASMIDNYQNTLRFLRGTNAGSDAYKMQIDMHTGQLQIPNYNSVTAFANSPVAALGVDSNGFVTTMTNARTPSLAVLPAMGSSIKAEPLWGGIQNYTGTSNQFANQRLIAQPVYLPVAATITGAKFFITVTGSYTANNYNGVGLYTISGATLTCVASSSNNGNLWSGSGGWTNNAFASTSFAFGANYSATPGLYYIALLHNNSAQTLLPSVGQQLATLGNTSTFDFTAGVKHTFTFASQTTMPTSIAMGAGQLVNGSNLYVALY